MNKLSFLAVVIFSGFVSTQAHAWGIGLPLDPVTPVDSTSMGFINDVLDYDLHWGNASLDPRTLQSENCGWEQASQESCVIGNGQALQLDVEMVTEKRGEGDDVYTLNGFDISIHDSVEALTVESAPEAVKDLTDYIGEGLIVKTVDGKIRVIGKNRFLSGDLMRGNGGDMAEFLDKVLNAINN